MQWYIQIGQLLSEWVVMCSMHAERENFWVALKNAGGAVSLVYIQVNDQYFADLTGRQQ